MYIGKSVNLKNRISSYLALNLGPKTESLIKRTKVVSYLKVASELEALLLESNLVKSLRPELNVELKDDKHPLYIVISKEKYPRVLTARKNQILNFMTSFGPFPSSQIVRSVLTYLRKIFPYSTHKAGDRPCFYSQMGLCNPCPSSIEKLKDKDKEAAVKIYRKNISMIRGVLSGKIDFVKNSLLTQMKDYSEKNEFEKALEVRDSLLKFEYITQLKNPTESFLENPNLIADLRSEEISALKKLLNKYFSIRRLRRIECFDVSHMSGLSTTSSMVTFQDGEPQKKYYRHFRIRSEKKMDDPASLLEVARRREGHLDDWGVPDLILVDGGVSQVAIFRSVFDKQNIPVIGLAKRHETILIFNKNLGFYENIRLKKDPGMNLLIRLRNEAHRFARKYHHNLVKRELFAG